MVDYLLFSEKNFSGNYFSGFAVNCISWFLLVPGKYRKRFPEIVSGEFGKKFSGKLFPENPEIRFPETSWAVLGILHCGPFFEVGHFEGICSLGHFEGFCSMGHFEGGPFWSGPFWGYLFIGPFWGWAVLRARQRKYFKILTINHSLIRSARTWPSQNNLNFDNFSVNALWYVCKFADDAERNCKAHWDGCLKKYVSTRAAFQSATSWFRSPENAGWDAAINAGWNGYKYGKCDYLLK